MASLERAASRAAFLAAGVNLAAAIVMLAILRPGLPAGEPSLAARTAHVHANATAWRAGWLVWNVAAIALLALFVALSLLWREWAPVLCRLALLAAAAGVAADIGAESIFMTVSPRLDGEQFALVESIAVGLTGFVGNGLYTVAGILLTWAGRRVLPPPVLAFGAAVWASGLTLSAATLVDSDGAQLLSAAVLMPLFVLWAASSGDGCVCAKRPRVLVAGGAGVFGRLLARELLRDFDVVVAGRDSGRLERVRRALGPGAQALVLDLAVPGALQRAARGSFAVACAAGPFQRLRAELPYETLRAGAHWLDIADAPGWVLPLLEDGALDVEARTAGLAVMTGLSSVPALTGALARRAAGELGGDATRARVTLYVGNRNTKGAGSIAAAIAGRFRDPVAIDLPAGRRRGYRFDSPDATLLARALGVRAEFRVALEWGIAARITALAGRVGSWGNSQALATLATPFGFFGSTAGIVQAEVRDEDGHTVTWAARADEQRLAVLPCALAAAWLLRGGTPGVIDPAEWLAPRLDALRAQGVRFLRRYAG